ncbi:MAG: hypothetical protein MZU84_09165 [Sphingobacterium sp.]|nr:hypothetical protein [Sphingobacterium sp.]
MLADRRDVHLRSSSRAGDPGGPGLAVLPVEINGPRGRAGGIAHGRLRKEGSRTDSYGISRACVSCRVPSVNSMRPAGPEPYPPDGQAPAPGIPVRLEGSRSRAGLVDASRST